MNISVLIPVYNAAAYVREAVESALAQPETAEIVLVEDGSPDDSLAVCQKLAAAYPTVKLYRHPDGKNHGAGATRNLAILNSTCEYAAFLDADDFFLPNRFSVASALFEADPELEGVYEAVDNHIEDAAGVRRWERAQRSQKRLATLTEEVTPEQLFSALVERKQGSLHLDGLVVKRTVFEKAGLFDEHLRFHQDTAMIWKMAAVARLMPGRIDESVAVRRIHRQNRISAPRPQSEIYRTKLLFWNTIWHWGEKNLDRGQQQIVLEGLLSYAMHGPRFNGNYPQWSRSVQKRIQLALLLFDYPSLILEGIFWARLFPSPQHWLRHLRGRLAQRPLI